MNDLSLPSPSPSPSPSLFSLFYFLQPAWFLMVGGDRSFKLALKEEDDEFSDELREDCEGRGGEGRGEGREGEERKGRGGNYEESGMKGISVSEVWMGGEGDPSH